MEISTLRIPALLLILGLSFSHCKTKSDSDEEMLLLLAVAASKVCANSSFTGTTVVNSTATLDTNTDCITGMTSSMSADLPAWIRNNFKCSVGSVSGSNYVFRSQNIPNNKSFYFGSSSPMYVALAGGQKSAGNNQISSQCLVYTIPSSPAAKSGTLVGTQSGYASVGITVNGLAIFNNAAAPGDTLATEAQTFDTFNGHPQSSGVYHHHSQPLNITNNDSKLIGMLIDGFPVYGLNCDNATAATGDDGAPGTVGPALDSNHGHTANTVLFPSGIYHYHFASDATAGINTLIGSNFHGTPGTVSN
ncbi:YHYH protein [Leptospira kanakyensis]|uniref:YHYH protein n=1 Tax=Leptospira kanakyensis TaxID=2484968 RepID=A0A6N4QL85_9LEPT|nr:YHYH protein [Leptospira kanakyensis]TGK55482.1 YHYH protein [Leptospira kanakyensis]TGK61016.1 YHYH protein [Leptospira kanakyensis]TGK76511.1 YHYH protein [Leptospira kanakyensis]